MRTVGIDGEYERRQATRPDMERLWRLSRLLDEANPALFEGMPEPRWIIPADDWEHIRIMGDRAPWDGAVSHDFGEKSITHRLFGYVVAIVPPRSCPWPELVLSCDRRA